jgi:hypothetical protein
MSIKKYQKNHINIVFSELSNFNKQNMDISYLNNIFRFNFNFFFCLLPY